MRTMLVNQQSLVVSIGVMQAEQNAMKLDLGTQLGHQLVNVHQQLTEQQQQHADRHEEAL